MLAEIEKAAIDYLAIKAPHVPHVDTMESGIARIKDVAYTLAITEGSAESSNQEEDTRQNVKLRVWVAFKNLKSDEARRKGAFPIVEAIAQLLLKQKLGLAIKKISYTGFTDVSDAGEKAAGTEVYQLDFSTSYIVSKLDEEETEELLSIGLNYLLNGSESTTAQDDVKLQQ